MNNKTALLIIDMQKDFFQKEELVKQKNQLVKNINDLSDKIKFYSKNNKIRQNIARSGQKKYFKLFNETKVSKYFIDISLGNNAKLL